MAEWPDIESRPVLDSFQGQLKDQVLHSPMDTGPDKTRRRSTASPYIAAFDMVFSASELEDFEDFYVNDIEGGSLEFDFTHPITGATITARFMEPYSVQYSGFRDFPWKLSLKLEFLP